MNNEFKPCQLCGCKAGLDYTMDISDKAERLVKRDFYFYCEKCGASTATCKTKEKAIVAWNGMVNENKTSR